MNAKDKFLRSLVHFYREGKGKRVVSLSYFCHSNGIGYAEIRTFAAELKAEGLLREGIAHYTYRLTDAGYRRYSTKVDMLDRTEGGVG